MQKKAISLFAVLAALSFMMVGGAKAEEVQYVFDTPSIASGDISRKAKAAVEGLAGVKSVSADTMKMSVSVTFDDARLSVSDVVSALGMAGCNVSTFKKK